MSAYDIKKSALKCFSQYGYEGTSLAMITEELGLKKQSIYAHYKSKEDIFMSVLNSVLQEEEEFLDEYFSRKYENAGEFLNNFISIIKGRFTSDKEYNIKFIIVTSYMPPEKLAKYITEKCNEYFDEIEKRVRTVILSKNNAGFERENEVQVFMTMVVGLFSALTYRDISSYEKRHKACYELFIKKIT